MLADGLAVTERIRMCVLSVRLSWLYWKLCCEFSNDLHPYADEAIPFFGVAPTLLFAGFFGIHKAWSGWICEHHTAWTSVDRSWKADNRWSHCSSSGEIRMFNHRLLFLSQVNHFICVCGDGACAVCTKNHHLCRHHHHCNQQHQLHADVSLPLCAPCVLFFRPLFSMPLRKHTTKMDFRPSPLFVLCSVFVRVHVLLDRFVCVSVISAIRTQTHCFSLYGNQSSSD